MAVKAGPTKAQSSQMRMGHARSSPTTTHTLRLIMNGSAGLNVTILYDDGGRPWTWRRGQSRASKTKSLNTAATHTPERDGDDADGEALAQLVEVLEEREAIFG